MASEEHRWVVKPDDARIDIAVGPDARLSPELRDALDNLARALEGQEDVQGFLMSSCQEVTISQDCRWYMSCKGVTG